VNELVAAFARLHHADPDRALIHLPASAGSMTIDHVWHEHLRCLDRLRASGLRPGELLLVAVGNRAATVPLFLAARALDVTVLPVDAGTTTSEIDDLVERFGAAAAVVPVETAACLAGRHLDAGDGLAIVARDAPPREYGDAALLKLTSGSTGIPKAARVTDSKLIADSEHIVTAMGIEPTDTQIAVIPLSHAYGASVVLVPLLIQGTAIVLRDSFVPHQVPADARAFRATTFPGVPFMFDYFVSNPPAGGWPDPLHRLISAGARLLPETIRGFHDLFGIKIHSFYGASESGGISYDASGAVTGEETVGHPLPGVTITLLPDEHTPAGTGRVHVRSDGVADGYVGGPSEEFCDGGFLTGDYGTFDAQGRLRLSGRVSTFINVAGKKVQPAEIEDVLRGMPGVREVRVVAAPDPQRGEQVVACLTLEPRAAGRVNTLSVRRFCSSRLAPHKIPRTVVVLDALPLTARGKTDRRALHEAIRLRIAGIPEPLC
jgi:long-chain acyl-CoA synthetase